MILSLLLLTTPAVAPHQTLEIRQMAAIEAAIEPGTLVVFDIDNTLIEPTHMLGSDQWFYALLDQMRREEKDEARATDRAMAIWNAVQADIEVHAIEPETPRLIEKLARNQVAMIALTARTFDIAAVTARQLRSTGIDFNRRALAPDLELALASPAKLIGGVLYAGEHNAKGEVLVALLRRLALAPKRIVFVDDKAKHVASVASALSAAKIPFVAFRYGGADDSVAAFRAETAAAEYRRWRSIRSDRDRRDDSRRRAR